MGATITGFDVAWIDHSVEADVQVKVLRRSAGIINLVGSVASSGSAGFGTSGATSLSETVDPGEQFLVEFIFPSASDPVEDGALCGLELHLS